MKTFLISLFVLLTASALTADEYDFRKTRWGMSKEEVKLTEDNEPAYEESDFFGYENEIAGMDCYVIYVFTSDKLVRTKYSFIHEHANRTDYIQDYQELKEILTKKYGQPVRDDQVWKNDLYRDNSSEWGMAVAVGHLVYQVRWATESTEIIIQLAGDNFDITLAIEYRSKNLRELEEKAKEEELMEAL